jgi:hypothetical protein
MIGWRHAGFCLGQFHAATSLRWFAGVAITAFSG